MRTWPAPPDFRYVGLGPAPIGAVRTVAAFVASAASRRRGLALLGGARSVAMAIVPWGIVVDPERDGRVLRWPAVRSVRLDLVHGRDTATPTTRWSFVTIETARERLRGRAPGHAPLERLEAHVEAYADEGARPIAWSLDGAVAAPIAVAEPAFEELLHHARSLLAGREGRALLSLPLDDYRGARAARPSPLAIATLRAALSERGGAPFDPRPLASVLAAELGANELATDLVRLVTSPHPVVAAIARAAALRLGAEASRAGAIDEVEPFLWGDDAEALRKWAR